MTAQPDSARRIELILQQIDALPTLPGVAMRLLQITSDDETDARKVIDLVRSDPVLTTRVLKLARSAHAGLRQAAVTVDRAVVLLGFEAIRNAVLSIKVFESFADDPTGAADDRPAAGFSRPAFWRHCLAVAIAAEMIAHDHRHQLDLKPAQAFACGLVHDLGKLALEFALPKSYHRVIELADQAQADIAAVERRLLGLDHHTAGKRLAEHWRLPHLFQDTMWLHGVPYDNLPDLEHRRMIGLVGLADLLVRSQHIGYSGNHQFRHSVEQRAAALGLDGAAVTARVGDIIEELERRAAALGLGDLPSRALFLESIQRANAMLGRLNSQLEARRRHADSQQATLQAIAAFHQQWSGPARSVSEVLGMVVGSARQTFGQGFYAMVYQPADQNLWQVCQFDPLGRMKHCELVQPPPHCPPLADFDNPQDDPFDWMTILPWLSDYLVGAEDLRHIRLLALPCGWGTAAIMLHDRSHLPPAAQLQALQHTWGSAIGAAAQHEGARRLGEQLAQAHRQLAEAQEELLHNQSLARLGEMAAGAAHEMNNPLMVISGRAQLLARALADAEQRQHAQLIAEQAARLSDMITALRQFAEPPHLHLVPANATDVIDRAIDQVRRLEPDGPPIRLHLAGQLPVLTTDPDRLAEALAELLLNAVQAQADGSVQLHAQVDRLSDRLVFKVVDHGPGMDRHTLDHAFDPFFSARPAGRRSGLGLPRARRIVQALGGQIELDSQPGQPTIARLSVPLNQSATGTKDESIALPDHRPGQDQHAPASPPA